jgi:hypothetical protein
VRNVYDHLEYQDVVLELKQKLQELRQQYGDSEELDQHYIDLYDNL